MQFWPRPGLSSLHWSAGHNYVWFQTNSLCDQTYQTIGFPVCVSPFNHNIGPLRYPRSRSSRRNASARLDIENAEAPDRNSTRATLAGCCASARWIEARRIAVMSQKSFGFMAAPLVRQWICHSPNVMKTDIFDARKVRVSVVNRLRRVSNLIHCRRIKAPWKFTVGLAVSETSHRLPSNSVSGL